MIKELKIRREFKLLLSSLDKNNIGYNIGLYTINFIIKYYAYLSEIFISQHSVFGFTIYYRVYYNGKLIFQFDEDKLKMPYNRYTMDSLILSSENKLKLLKFNRPDLLKNCVRLNINFQNI